MDRFEDCDRCGERYWDDAIANLRDEEQPDGEVLRVCCCPTMTSEQYWRAVLGERSADQVVTEFELDDDPQQGPGSLDDWLGQAEAQAIAHATDGLLTLAMLEPHHAAALEALRAAVPSVSSHCPSLRTGGKALYGGKIVRVGARTKLRIGGPHRHTSAGIVAESLLRPIEDE